MFLFNLKKYLNFFMITIFIFSTINCSRVAIIGGTIGEIDKTEKALAVEKCIYAIEKENGIISELSFVDGYVRAIVNGYNVYANVYEEDNGTLNVSFSVTKYLSTNNKLAEKLLNNYRNFRR